MAVAINSFEELCVDALVSLLKPFLVSQGCNVEVVPGQIKDTETSPRVVVSATQSVEAIFQSGIYELTVEFTARVNVDVEDGTSDTNPESIGQLFGHVMDFLQQPDLKQQVTQTGRVFLHGVVLEGQRLDQVDDRRWWKSCEMKFHGFATPG